MITVKVPATSANLGCGFDCLGLALQMYNTFTFEKIESGIEWINCDSAFANEDNLIYRSFVAGLQSIGKQDEIKGIKIGLQCDVPVSRGLGSSATCIVGGIVGAYAITDTPIDKDEILKIATKIEGHPDNVAPAIFGGLRASCSINGEVYSKAYNIDENFYFQVLIPNFETKTSEARAVIPSEIKHSDAIYSLSRLSIVLKAFEEHDLETLSKCMGDKLHEPYRATLIHEFEEVKAICQSVDSVAFLISGSGSTLLNIIVDPSNEELIKEKLEGLQYDWNSKVLQMDMEGVEIC